MILECRILPAARLFYYSFSIISERTRRESKNTNFFLALQRIILSLFILFSLLPHSINGSRQWNLYGPDRSGIYGGVQGIRGLKACLSENTKSSFGIVNNHFGDVVGLMSGGSFTPYQSALGSYGPMPGSSVNQAFQPQWRSHYLDQTGFICMGARYYDPQSGRFISPDPLGHSSSLNLYDYCNGDPVNGLDPDGRCVEGTKAGWANGNGAFAGMYDSSHANSQLAYGLGWTVGGAFGDVNAMVARPVAYAAALSLYGLNTSIESTENFLGGPGARGAIGFMAPVVAMEAEAAASATVVEAAEASSISQTISPIIKETLSDNDFVRFDPTYLDDVIETGGIQKRFFDQEKIWLTKYGDIKNVTTATELEQILYRKNLWPNVEGKFSNGATLRLINKIEHVVPAGITNKTNGVRQWRMTHDIPASNLDLIFRLPQ